MLGAYRIVKHKPFVVLASGAIGAKPRGVNHE